MRTCVMDDCDKKHFGRGWCRTHYERWRQHGDPNVVLSTRHYLAAPLDRFMDNVWIVESGCWLWTASVNSSGHPMFRSEIRSENLAHRWSYRQFSGEIPEGMMIDHACRTRSCVNPDHLRLATRAQNGWNRDGRSVRSKSGSRNVYPGCKPGTWKVVVIKEGTPHNGGVYGSIQEAAESASNLRERLFGDYAGAA